MLAYALHPPGLLQHTCAVWGTHKCCATAEVVHEQDVVVLPQHVGPARSGVHALHMQHASICFRNVWMAIAIVCPTYHSAVALGVHTCQRYKLHLNR